MSEENKLVSLKELRLDQENLDNVSTPRSMEALKRQGMMISELKKLSREEVKQIVIEKYGKKIKDEKIMDLYEKHFEDRREMKLKLLLEVREEVVKEQE